MDEQLISEFPDEFTESLLKFCDAPAPEPAFVTGLEQKLLRRQALLLHSEKPGRKVSQVWKQFSASLARRRWQYAAVMVLVVFALTLLAIGPQRVLAQVQRWLGYVPGVGFVDLVDTQVLISPIEITRDGVTIRVEKVIAGLQRTEVVISCPGLSEEDLPWSNKTVENTDFAAYLLLPDGTRLETTRWELSIGAGKLEFPALPPDVYHLNLLVVRLPLVPQGALPEDWVIPIVLRPADDALITELFPLPYSPPDACDTHHEISLCVHDVAQTSTETAIQYQLSWTNPDWTFWSRLGWMRSPELRDNLGHIYWESMESNGSSVAVVAISAPDVSQATNTPTIPKHTDMVVFQVLSLSAQQATLWVNALEFRIPAEGDFSLNLGDNPQIGDTWPLDLHLDIAGLPVHLTGASLREEKIEMGEGESEQSTYLEFNLDPLDEQEGFSLTSFDLSNPDLGVYGQGGWTMDAGTVLYKGRLEFSKNGNIPHGSFTVQVTGATLLAHGPWEATWNIPGRDPANSALPVHLLPTPDNQPDGEIQPVIEEAILSDRLTAIKFNAVGLPLDTTFVQVLTYDPVNFSPFQSLAGLYLEDNLERRYEPGRNLAIIRPSGDEDSDDPHWLFFSPLEPLAQEVTVHVPYIELFVPGQASFTVAISQNTTFTPEEYTVNVIDGSGPEHQETKTRMVSDARPVDISFELAGYELHFTQAQLVHEQYSDSPYQLILKGESLALKQGILHLNRLSFTQVERPDGQVVQIDSALQTRGMISYPYGVVAPAEIGSNQMPVYVILDVTATNGVDLLVGSYRVEMNGVSVWISGPWELSFSLSGY